VKSRFTLWTVAVVLTIAIVWVSVFTMDPFPPRRISIATGQPDGTYEALGREYQRRLRREGLTVDLRRTAGSVENVELLRRGEIDVAFVQGGIYQPAEDPEQRLRGMAAIYREPLWIFYRGKPIGDGLASLAGRRISIGAPGSGTEAVTRALFDALGLSTAGANVVRLTSSEARRALEEERIDAAFFVASYADVNVVALVNHEEEIRGGSALHYAVRRRYKDVLKLLASMGIDMNAVDQDGLTALDYTQSRGFMPFMALQTPIYKDEAALLRELGATKLMAKSPEWPVLGPPQGVWEDIWPLGESRVHEPVYKPKTD